MGSIYQKMIHRHLWGINNTLMRILLKVVGLVMVCSLFGTNLRAQIIDAEYGFIQNPMDPAEFTAVFYPDNSTSGPFTPMVQGSVFSFLLPAGTVPDPSVNPQFPFGDGVGSFNNINGDWSNVEYYPNADLAALTGFPDPLGGVDLYLVTLNCDSEIGIMHYIDHSQICR